MHAVFILLSSLFAISKAIQMECGSGSNVLEVEENSIFTLKCSGYSGTAIWARRIPGYAEQNIGICNASSCQKDEELNIVLTYLSSGSSSITSPHSSRENGNVTYSCTANSITKTCVTNIFVKSSLSNASVFFNRADKWSLNGNINITRIYSSVGRFQCQWKSISSPFSGNGRLLPSNLLLTPSPGDLQNKADRFGTCSFRDNVTNYSDNIYKFTVLVTPGDISVTTDMIEIVRPLAPSTDCVTSNIPENSTLRCTCRTQQVGKPGGRLLWITGKDGILNQIINVGSYDVDTLQIGPQRLTRNDDGTQFQCIVDWATNVTGTLYTSNVNYGPDSVQIPENRTFYTDINGTQELRLTCQAIGVKPLTGIVYNWSSPCLGFTNSSCTFRPRPPNKNGISNEVKCTARNPFNNNISSETTFRVDLKYPPLQIPKITGYSHDLIVYTNDSLTFTCLISGGNPIISNTVLACSTLARNTSTGDTAIIHFSVPEGVDRLECNCSGTWIVPDFYSLNSNVQFSVYYPPSSLVILQNDTNTFPYLEGDIANIVCAVETSAGNPAAELTWSGYRGNQVGSRRIPTTLQLTLQREDNNRNITCTATNKYTDIKGIVISRMTLLKVYYRPVISLSHDANSECELSSNQSSCYISEDQFVHIMCTADSNPSPANITWRLEPTRPLVSNNGQLNLTASRAVHNSTYTCIVTTQKNNDSRLPLTSQRELLIFIKSVKSKEQSSSNIGGIVGGSLGGLTFIVLITGFTVIIKKKRKDDKSKAIEKFGKYSEDVSKPETKIATHGQPNSSNISLSKTDIEVIVNQRSAIASASAYSTPVKDVYTLVNKHNAPEPCLSSTNGQIASKISRFPNSALTNFKHKGSRIAKRREKTKTKVGKKDSNDKHQQNALMSRKLPRGLLYENVELNAHISTNTDLKMNNESEHGLVYSTLQFTEKQGDEEEKAPIKLKSDSTEYAFIDFSKNSIPPK